MLHRNLLPLICFLLLSCQKPEHSALQSESWPEVAPTDVIVQLFNWPFAKITEEIPRLAQMGYAQIHVSPPNLTIPTDQWWGRYQPVDYTKIEGPLGDQAQFEAMIRLAHRYNIRVIADIVFNHVAGSGSPLFEPNDYHPAFCIQNYDDVNEVRNGRMCGGAGDTGMPDLDQNSPHVLALQQQFLRWLGQMGVDGFRMDAVKHMEPGYFNRLLTPELAGGKIVFGEVIADEFTYDRDLAPYLQNTAMAFYDFPLRRTLQTALGPYGDLSALVDPSNPIRKRSLSWDRSIAFIMNHDIPNNEGFRSMILNPTDETLAYAYLLGRSEGVPYVFADLGIAGGGGIQDDRWAYAHRSAAIQPFLYFHNAVHGTDMQVIHADSCRLIIKRGEKGVLAINKCNGAFEKDVSVAAADFLDLTHNTRIRSQGTLHLSIPGRSALAWIAL